MTFKRSLLTAGTVSLLSAGNCLLAHPSYAISLDFNDWDSIGNVQPVTSNSAQANSGTASTAIAGGGTDSLEDFLEIAPGSLDNLAPDSFFGAVRGSAIKKTIVVQAGDKLTFNWNLTLAFNQELGAFDLDKAFVTINDSINPLNIDNSLTGIYEYIFPNAGNFLVGIGIVDIDDAGGESQLIVSSPTLEPVPEPLTILGVFTGFGCGLIMQRRFGKKS
ncbi:PEP-CTERM sorting domain-containing protein [Nostoc sp. CMAA1605]|uniref:PEP-CTERM sorting domain-containing protein n=1 Tax=Nostoc sp. CMAA1605 TaxID=2055159 RepID=UPI001F22EBE9|nr:PEP-CTERM sorting domain-containing protein [Nostoc sp. CMAA1605]